MTESEGKGNGEGKGKERREKKKKLWVLPRRAGPGGARNKHAPGSTPERNGTKFRKITDDILTLPGLASTQEKKKKGNLYPISQRCENRVHSNHTLYGVPF